MRQLVGDIDVVECIARQEEREAGLALEDDEIGSCSSGPEKERHPAAALKRTGSSYKERLKLALMRKVGGSGVKGGGSSSNPNGAAADKTAAAVIKAAADGPEFDRGGIVASALERQLRWENQQLAAADGLGEIKRHWSDPRPENAPAAIVPATHLSLLRRVWGDKASSAAAAGRSGAQPASLQLLTAPLSPASRRRASSKSEEAASPVTPTGPQRELPMY